MTNMNNDIEKSNMSMEQFKAKIEKEVLDSKRKYQNELERVKSENKVLKQFIERLKSRINKFLGEL